MRMGTGYVNKKAAEIETMREPNCALRSQNLSNHKDHTIIQFSCVAALFPAHLVLNHISVEPDRIYRFDD